MRILKFILLASVLLTSCLEDFEPNSASFLREFNSNVLAVPNGLFEMEDEGFVIYGIMKRSYMEPGGGALEIEETYALPTIIRTDKFGNEQFRVSYPIDTMQNFHHPLIAGKEGITYSYFKDMIQLKNGNFLATLNLYIERVGQDAPAYMILNKDFELMTFKFFNDEEKLDPDDGIDIWRDSPPQIFQIPSSTDVLLLFRLSNNFFSGNPFTIWYSVYRMSMDGNIIWKGDYASSSQFLYGNSLVIDSHNNVVVAGMAVGDAGFGCTRTFIDNIDVETGVRLSHNIIDDGSKSHYPVSIVENQNGYAVQVYAKTICDEFEPIGGSIILLNGDLSFNSEIALTNESLVTDGWGSNVKLIQCNENEYIAAYRTETTADNRDWGTVITKSGPSGWTWKDPVGNLEAFIGTRDGGCAALLGRTGIRLVKLNPYGKLE